MTHHKFKLGQAVQFTPDKLQPAKPAGEYKITRLLPSSGRDMQYRIKNALEPYERIAQEGQLVQA